MIETSIFSNGPIFVNFCLLQLKSIFYLLQLEPDRCVSAWACGPIVSVTASHQRMRTEHVKTAAISISPKSAATDTYSCINNGNKRKC